MLQHHVTGHVLDACPMWSRNPAGPRATCRGDWTALHPENRRIHQLWYRDGQLIRNWCAPLVSFGLSKMYFDKVLFLCAENSDVLLVRIGCIQVKRTSCKQQNCKMKKINRKRK